jgi:hypothetical protein
VSLEPTIQQEDPINPPIPIKSTPVRDPLTSPFAFSSPLKLTKTRRFTKPPFDPTIEQSTPHIVTIYFITVINGIQKDQTFTKTININNPDRESLFNL